LDVQRQLLVDLLIDSNAPEPRTEGALHLENRIFETPVENRRHVAVSASSCSRPESVRRYSLARRPSSDVPHSASTQPRRSRRYRAGYSDPSSTSTVSSVESSMKV